jgi:glyoxylase-like metal-dependent hydrolase (beta-lactamase superfamily II)
MTLYDSALDATHKAMRGLGLSPSDLGPGNLAHVLSQPADDPALVSLANTLCLDANALAHMDDPWPEIALPERVRQIVVPFEDDTVNLWLITHPDGSLLIDAGFQPEDLTQPLAGLTDFDLLITHPHRDHIGGLPALSPKAKQTYSPVVLPGCASVVSGVELSLGPWRIRTHDLRGHHPQSLGYRIQGEGLDLMVVGDALYARSIGGCAGPEAFGLARETLMALWPTLKPETLILTGHGPATRVDRETTENPFIAGWLKAERAQG